MQKHMMEDPVPPQEINAEVTAEVSALITRLLQKEPGARFDSWQALIDQIDNVTSGGGEAPAEAAEEAAPAASEAPAADAGVQAPPVQSEAGAPAAAAEKKGCGAAVLAFVCLVGVTTYFSMN